MAGGVCGLLIKKALPRIAGGHCKARRVVTTSIRQAYIVNGGRHFELFLSLGRRVWGYSPLEHKRQYLTENLKQWRITFLNFFSLRNPEAHWRSKRRIRRANHIVDPPRHRCTSIIGKSHHLLSASTRQSVRRHHSRLLCASCCKRRLGIAGIRNLNTLWCLSVQNRKPRTRMVTKAPPSPPKSKHCHRLEAHLLYNVAGAAPILKQ